MPLICVASPKGGVGKTSLVAGLAEALSRMGRRVIAMDCDPQNALRLHFGVPITATEGYLASLASGPDWRSFLRTTPYGVTLLPHGETDLRGALAAAETIEREPEWLLAPVRAMCEDPACIVLADMPPGASVALSVLKSEAALVLVVLFADAASTALLPDIEEGRFLGQGTLGTLTGPRLVFALNQVDRGMRLSVAAAEGLATHLGPRLVGAICRDEAMAEALACQKPIGAHAPASAAARDVAMLASALLRLLPAPEPAPIASPLFPWLRR